MPNKYQGAILAVALVAAGLVGWQFVSNWRDSSARQMRGLSPKNLAAKPSDAGLLPERGPADRAPGNHALLPAEPTSSRNTVARDTVRDRFTRATDYATFVASVLPAAKDGDADSQFYLYSALDYCDREYSAYFRKPGGGWRTLDEALVRTAVRPTERTTAVEEAHARCHSLMRGDRQRYGDTQTWLERATGAGQPVAMATTARNELLDLRATRDSTKQTPRADPRELLAAAVKSKDPAVLWQIGELQGRLHGDNSESTKAQWAWWLAACQRGYDCGEKSAWYEFSCRFDQMCLPGQTGIDYMRRTLQSDFPEVESMAKAINAKIDAGAWSELDISS